MLGVVEKRIVGLTFAASYVYVYAFSRRFYPKRLTNEDITSYKKQKQ